MIALECFLSFVDTFARNHIPETAFTNAARTAYFDKFLILEKSHHAVQDTRKGQFDNIRDMMPGEVAAKVKHFQHEIGNIEFG